MNKAIAIVVCMAGLMAPEVALAENFRSELCEGEQFVGNPPRKYPHLHCERKDFKYSATESVKSDLLAKGGCTRAKDLVDDPPYSKKNTEEPGKIKAALERYIAAYCK